MPAVPTLSVVIPVYNEPRWIIRSVEMAATSIRNSPFAPRAEMLIVDDGSDEPTKRVLAQLDPEIPLRVLTQENRGRFAARRAGIEAAEGELVLLLDSRAFLEPDSLRFVADGLDEERLPVWNGHVNIDVEGSPFARFWRTFTYAAWRDYFAAPRTTSFGIDEFDRYPKGTTCFLAPRDTLLGAMRDFRSLYDDDRLSNDDTHLIRLVASQRRINISPAFACVYVFARDSLPGFVRHAFHRGTVFVDGFGRPGTRFFPVVVAFFPTSVIWVLLLLTRPRWALSLLAALAMTAASAASALRRPPGDVVAFGSLTVPFALAYSAGIWRGGILAALGFARRRAVVRGGGDA